MEKMALPNPLLENAAFIPTNIQITSTSNSWSWTSGLKVTILT